MPTVWNLTCRHLKSNSDFQASLSFDLGLYFTFWLPLWGKPARVALHGRLVAFSCRLPQAPTRCTLESVQYEASLVVVLPAAWVKPWQASHRELAWLTEGKERRKATCSGGSEQVPFYRRTELFMWFFFRSDTCSKTGGKDRKTGDQESGLENGSLPPPQTGELTGMWLLLLNPFSPTAPDS